MKDRRYKYKNKKLMRVNRKQKKAENKSLFLK